MKDDVEMLIAKLFRAPRGGQVTPQMVASRARRLLPAGDAFRTTRCRAARIARARREIEWQEMDRLGKQIAREVDLAPMESPRLTPENEGVLLQLSQALMWGWGRHLADPNPRPPLCFFCHQPAAHVVRGATPVCAQHVPRTADAQRAARLVRWAGSPARLHEMVLHQAAEIRATASNAELENVLAAACTDPVTRRWWSLQPDLELPIRILAHRHVEARYHAWVNEQRIAGGRARAVPRPVLERARKKVRGGMSRAAAARAVGVSEATLRRRWRRDPVPVL
ncbi:hypothetical protein [Acidiferrobacter sp.]|uniref:hypothetical protein n=1 Tax=Acidiferrobacter sp. TaxID=1872107 RepID=UPI002619091F|nr:hypothetical protein [Acidiferrobacter sp.]